MRLSMIVIQILKAGAFDSKMTRVHLEDRPRSREPAVKPAECLRECQVIQDIFLTEWSEAKTWFYFSCDKLRFKHILVHFTIMDMRYLGPKITFRRDMPLPDFT